ncbi:MAG: type II secretion system minor pseudopilin GspI [Sphingomonas sp.]
MRRERGFTLIEMMVALAVFSLAALALIRLESTTIRGAAILDTALTAQMVADNVAIETVTDAQPPVLGSVTGVERNGGRTWAWRRTTTSAGNARVAKVEVIVTGADGVPRGRLTMVRLAQPPAALAVAPPLRP